MEPRLLGLLSGAARALLSPRNYSDPAGPRFSGRYGRPWGAAHTLRLVTFNLRFARRIDRAIELFESCAELRGADVVVLQEMDEHGVERIARRLHLNYVYYPAAVHPLHGKNFGNALLSRWHLEADRKVLLPHLGRGQSTQRIAVGGTVVAGRRKVRVYSVHLGTPIEIRYPERKRQVEAVLEDAAGFRLPVIILGDMNGRRIGRFLEERGFFWATKRCRRTIGPFSWDHVFVRGLDPGAAIGAGVVRDNRRASDHKPVWLVLRIDRDALHGPSHRRRPVRAGLLSRLQAMAADRLGIQPVGR